MERLRRIVTEWLTERRLRQVGVPTCAEVLAAQGR